MHTNTHTRKINTSCRIMNQMNYTVIRMNYTKVIPRDHLPLRKRSEPIPSPTPHQSHPRANPAHPQLPIPPAPTIRTNRVEVSPWPLPIHARSPYRARHNPALASHPASSPVSSRGTPPADAGSGTTSHATKLIPPHQRPYLKYSLSMYPGCSGIRCLNIRHHNSPLGPASSSRSTDDDGEMIENVGGEMGDCELAWGE